MATTRSVLTIDRGNTTVDLLLHAADGARDRHRAAPDALDLDGWLGDRTPSYAAGVTVVAGGLDHVRAVLAGRGVELAVAGRELVCPLDLAYAEPATLGPDRWVGAVAARARYGDALVVDCGSATTFDLVTAAGRFLGGCIAPGLHALASGLAAAAPALPSARLDAAPILPATTTQDAVDAGVLDGAAALIDGLVARLLPELGDDATVVLTGGGSERVASRSRLAFVRHDALVHEGLRWLLDARAGRD